MMNRREALTAMMGALGLASTASVFGAAAFAGSAVTGAVRPVLSNDEIRLLDDVGETILPETPGSPGAKAARIGQFMQEMVSDYYTLEEQSTFLKGLGGFHRLCSETYGKSFSDLNADQRKALLLNLENDHQASYYQMIKQLTVWGYFSSEVGVKQALRFAPVPGRYDGNVKIEPGTRAWANIGA